VYILDEHQHPVAAGAEGEIWIGGKSVGRGYRNQSELTARKFWPDPFSSEPGARMYRTGDRGRWLDDGEIAFCGRADRQVKIGGIRIELDEIALALQRHPRVGSALVEASELPGRGKVLTAYVVPRTRGEPPPTPLDLRRFLYRTLPRNYIPAFFMTLDAMPLTRNGKVDRTRLPKPQLPASGTTADGRPLSLLETRVVEIMREALDLETLGLDDNFFLLGGHSLVATRVIVRCREVLGVSVALRDLFEADSIGEFVEAIHDRLAAQLLTRPDRRAADRVDASSWA
jgi:acyl carrier protein